MTSYRASLQRDHVLLVRYDYFDRHEYLDNPGFLDSSRHDDLMSRFSFLFRAPARNMPAECELKIPHKLCISPGILDCVISQHQNSGRLLDISSEIGATELNQEISRLRSDYHFGK